MAHPENILLCAIMDEDQDYRKIALEKILLARRDAQVNQPILVRNLHLPLITSKQKTIRIQSVG